MNVPGGSKWLPGSSRQWPCFVTVHAVLCCARLTSVCVKGLTSAGGNWCVGSPGGHRGEASSSVQGDMFRTWGFGGLGGDCRCRDAPVCCSTPWLWGSPVCILLLKRRQKCTGRCTGSFKRFCSGVVCHPKSFLCLGDSDHPWLSSLSALHQNPGMHPQTQLVAPTLGKVSCWQGHQEHLKRLADFFFPCCSLK